MHPSLQYLSTSLAVWPGLQLGRPKYTFFVSSRTLGALDLGNLDRTQPLWASIDAEFDALCLIEALVAITLNVAVMDKHVVGAFSRYKAIALFVTEPLDGSHFSIAHCFVSLLEIEYSIETKLKAIYRNKNRRDTKVQAGVTHINLESCFTLRKELYHIDQQMSNPIASNLGPAT
jgi:hypothetical protein